MSLSLIERKKLVSMLEQKFPLAQTWKENKGGRVFGDKKEFSIFSGVLLGAASAAGFLMHLGNLNNNVLYVLPAGLLIFAVLAGSIVWIEHSLGSIKRYKINKNINNYTEHMRDYVKQNAYTQKVKVLLKDVCEEDLNLLCSNPNLNPVFKECFVEELRRRDDIKTVEKISTEFLSETIPVEQVLDFQYSSTTQPPHKFHL